MVFGPQPYVPGPNDPTLPPHLRMEDTSPDAILKSLKELPFFMESEADIGENAENNIQLEALRALSYDGDPVERATNFKNHGNDCYKLKQFHDAVKYYDQALDQGCDVPEINVACHINKAACNLELKNYGKCITDCKKALELDAKNSKAIYRCAKAYLAVDRLDECKLVVQYGMNIDPENKAFEIILNEQEKKRQRRDNLKKLQQIRQREREMKKTCLSTALQAKQIAQQYTLQGGSSAEKSSELGRIRLISETDPSSELLLTVLFLYPLQLQSDLVENAPENATVSEYLEQLFETPAQWILKSSESSLEYTLDNINVYGQTASGGLARIGKNSTLLKVLSRESPKVPLIDDNLQLFIIPKNKEGEWLSSWDKQRALNQLVSD